MSEGGQDPYSVVLADLRAQRDKLENAISAIEALRGGGPKAPAPANDLPAQDRPAAALGAGAFLGLTIVDAAKKLLAIERRKMSNAEIVEKLSQGGLVLNSADKLNTVGSVLNRRFMQVGDVVRVGRGTWGLKEWYPNRGFKPKGENQDPARPTDDDLRDLGLGSTTSTQAVDADLEELIGPFS